MSVALITPPAVEPVTLSDLKLQLGLSPNEDTDHARELQLSTQMRRLLQAARAACEDYTRRVFITQTWKLNLDGWPRESERYGHFHPHAIRLPKQPFQSVTSFVYTSTDGTVQDMAVYTYQTDPGSETQPARLLPPYLQPWPPLRLVPNNVVIEFVCGYGDTGAAVPVQICQAILFLAQFYFENGAISDLAIPRVVERLLDPYVNRVS